jgi:hypothetical protein
MTSEKLSKEEGVQETFLEVTCPECKTIRKERNFNPAPKIGNDLLLKSIYEPLQSGTRDIRVLTLLRGTFMDDIRCELQSVSLDDDPAFTALSYCWGDEKLRGYIWVNDHEISVTKSLEIALRYMRRNRDEMVVWADAICINQNDTHEKSVQVSIMGKLYSRG